MRLCKIPTDIGVNERILRGLFSPMHFDRKKTKLLPSTFYPRPNENGVSVIRLEFTAVERGRAYIRQFETVTTREYIGFAKILSSQIASLMMNNAVITIEHKPEPDCPAHAEIYFFDNGNLVPKIKGEELPADVRYLVKKLCDLATPVFIDPRPNSRYWMGRKM
jgi:hypothetical protein